MYRTSLIFLFLFSFLLTVPNYGNASTNLSSKAFSHISDGSNEKVKTGPLHIFGNPFEQLEEYYFDGTLPSLDDLEGWHTGRCFSPHIADQATNALLVLIPDHDHSGGPLFPGGRNKILVIVNKNKPADYFDDMSDSKAERIRRIIQNTKDHITGVEEVDWSLASENRHGGLEYRVRKFYSHHSGSYLVNRNVSVSTGMTFDMCYFFDRVH